MEYDVWKATATKAQLLFAFIGPHLFLLNMFHHNAGKKCPTIREPKLDWDVHLAMHHASTF